MNTLLLWSAYAWVHTSGHRDGRFKGLMALYAKVLDRACIAMKEEGRRWHESRNSAAFLDLFVTLHESGFIEEIALLEESVAAVEDRKEQNDHEVIAVTNAANSGKKIIEEKFKNKLIKQILHTLNELLAIFRGAIPD